MRRSLVERRLRDVHARLIKTRAELAVLDEQLVVVGDVVDETRLRALVAETPGSAREHDEASRHAAAVIRLRQILVDTVRDLEHRQDDLLDRLPPMSSGRGD
jgi:hypothetical protein